MALFYATRGIMTTLLEVATKAREKGEIKITWECTTHGETEFYTSSRVCCACTLERKTPEKQARHWAKVKKQANEKRRAKYAASKGAK